MRVTDLALLILAHEFRKQDFESAVYDVLDKAANLEQEVKARVYAMVVDTCNPHSTVDEIERALRKGYRG